MRGTERSAVVVCGWSCSDAVLRPDPCKHVLQVLCAEAWDGV